MKTRRVEILIEVESNMSIVDIKEFYKELNCSGDVILEPLEVRVNIIKEIKSVIPSLKFVKDRLRVLKSRKEGASK